MVENETLAEPTERTAHIIAGARYTLALVGAGISVESGIPPFRGPGGLWTRLGEPAMDGYQKFIADPTAWWAARVSGEEDEISQFLKMLEGAKPNAAHYALAEMEQMRFLHHVITQNIDNLHQEAGSKEITEIHGNRTKLRCIACGARFPLREYGAEEIPPRCPHCQGILKSDTVMFGEPIPRDALLSCETQTRRCDCMLLVGTSATVYPAAEFPLIAARSGACLIEINPMETPLSGLCQVVLRAPAAAALPKLVEKLRDITPSGSR
jgi:NAD-dependent deacetylase